MLADGLPPLFFSLMKPACYYGLKSKRNKMRLVEDKGLFKRKKKRSPTATKNLTELF
jgi:hypothetical protein